MVPGILSLADIAQSDDQPNFYAKEHPSFKPTTSIPWIASLPFPAVAGWIGTMVAGPVSAKTPDNSIRIRNAVSGLIMAVPTFFSWKAVLDDEVIVGVRVAAGVTGTFFGLASLLMFYNAIRPGPFVKTRSQFASWVRKQKT
jgi:hypothetical protein